MVVYPGTKINNHTTAVIILYIQFQESFWQDPMLVRFTSTKGNQSLSPQQLWVWFLVMASQRKSKSITTTVVSLIPGHGKEYLIQPYVNKVCLWLTAGQWLLWLMSLWFSCLATHNTIHSSPILNPASTVFQTLDFPFAKQASVVFQNCFTLEIFGGNTK